MTAARDWKKQRTIARLKDKPLVAIVHDGPESTITMYVDAPWQAFAVAWWNDHYGYSASVAIVAAAYILPTKARWWFEGGLRDWASVSAGKLWSRSSLSARGFVEGVDYTVVDTDVSQAVDEYLELTRAGKDKALGYARAQIEQECAAENKPLPWEVV